MEDGINRLTFPTYETASRRSKVEQLEESSSVGGTYASKAESFDLYSIENMTPIFSAAVGLLGTILGPYVVLPTCIYIIYSSSWYSGPLLPASSLILPAIALICIVNIYMFSYYKPVSHVSGIVGFNSVGATTTPGLYHSSSTFTSDLLVNCPLLTASTSAMGCLPTLPSTPWIFSGDMRTILPFLTFKPKEVSYIRRWVRVSLSDGPLESMVHQDQEENSFEAVALDCSFAKTTETNKDINEESTLVKENEISAKNSTNQLKKSKEANIMKAGNFEKCDDICNVDGKFVLLILAGLTGGSSEGYVIDLVREANQQGVDCFVMLGRGLGSTPNLSDAAFHGARTSDVRETARVLRQTFPPSTRIFVVGISMGGIIVTNAVGRSVLTGIADGAISIGGCFDTAKNINFTQSRSQWQPLLTFGLKDSFVSPKGALEKMAKRMGPKARDIVYKAKDIIDYDSCVVTALHGFRDAYHYYSDMSGCSDQRLLAMISKEKLLKKMTAKTKSEVEVEVEDVGRQSVERWKDDIPFVCLRTVIQDARTAEFEIKSLKLKDEIISMVGDDSDWIKVKDNETDNDQEQTKEPLNNENTENDRNSELREELPRYPPPLFGLPIPLLSIHASDDPIIHVDTMPCRSGLINAVENMFVLFQI